MREVKEYYDEFAKEQVNFGINLRHLRILSWLEKFGMKQDSKILEIGCGIGTQTELIAKYLRGGSATAMDISPKSIDIASQRLKGFSNVKLLAADVTEGIDEKETFDIILLPDVLEHIPLASHSRLFANLKNVLRRKGFILIHIPDPYYLKWLSEHHPESLQIIDQSVYTDELIKNIYPHRLYVFYLESYCIWTNQPDYQVIVLKHIPEEDYNDLNNKQNFFQRIKGKLGF
jgi:cyclopropane fatty-acyl-phospholipid synthase-like methyltransferase